MRWRFCWGGGADPRMRDSWGLLLVERGEEKGDGEVVEILRACGCSSLG